MATSASDINARRWATVQQYGLLETVPGALFETILRVAANLCDTPMATLSFNDRTRERFVACRGCALDTIALDKGFSDFITTGGTSLLVGDTRTDTRFRKAPLLKADPDLRFYAGVPVVTREGVPLGTLAVMDHTARHLPDEKVAALELLGEQVLPLFRAECETKIGGSQLRAITNDPDGLASHFDTVFNALPGVHWLVELERFDVIGISQAALHAISKAREEVIGHPLSNVLQAGKEDKATVDSSRALFTSAKRVARTGETDQLIAHPFRARTKSDELETRYWNVVNSPVRNTAGKIVYVIGHAVDVTELVRLREREGKAAEDRKLLEVQAARMEEDILRRSREIERLNEHLHIAQAVANVGSWEMESGEHGALWSDEVYRIIGAPSGGEAAEDPILEAVHPDDRKRLEDRRRLAKKKGKPVELTHRIVRPDGSIRHVHQQIRVDKKDDGKDSRLYGTIQDITRQKQIEAELHTRARQQEVVSRFGQKALEGSRLEELLDEAADLIVDTLDVEYCKVLKLLPDGKAMKLVAGRGWKDGLIGKATVSIGRGSQAGYTLMQKHSVIVKDLRYDKRFTGPALLREHGVVSGISVIIPGQDEPWGALGAHSTRLRNFTQDDVNFFESIANILAEVASLRRVTEEMNGRTGRLNALLEIARHALSGVTLNELQQFAAERIAEALDIELVKIAERLSDDSGMKVVAGVGWQSGVVNHAILSIGGSSQGGYLLHTEDTVTIKDLPTETRFRPSPVCLEHGVDSGIATVIRGDKGPIGMIGAHTTRRRDFQSEEVDFLRQVASILGDVRRQSEAVSKTAD